MRMGEADSSSCMHIISMILQVSYNTSHAQPGEVHTAVLSGSVLASLAYRLSSLASVLHSRSSPHVLSLYDPKRLERRPFASIHSILLCQLYSGLRSFRSGRMRGCHCARNVMAVQMISHITIERSGSRIIPHISQQLQADNMRVDLQTLFGRAVSICTHIDGKAVGAREVAECVYGGCRRHTFDSLPLDSQTTTLLRRPR